MTDDTSTLNGVGSYLMWLDYADEITDYDREMSEKIESAKRDYDAQRNNGMNGSYRDCTDNLFDDYY